MPSFGLHLSDSVLNPDSIESLLSFATYSNSSGLSSSAKAYGNAIAVLLRPGRYDAKDAADSMRLLAMQRMVLYADMIAKTVPARLPGWIVWLDRLEQIQDIATDPRHDQLELVKEEMRLSIDLITHAKSLLKTDALASSVTYASACDVGEAADVMSAVTMKDRTDRAKAIARLAKQYCFSE